MCVNKPKVLVVDAGNTRIKWTLFNAKEIVDKWTGDEVISDRIGDIDAIAYGSVRTDVHDQNLINQIKQCYPQQDLCVIQSEAYECGVENRYKEPNRLGVDRWLGVIAAFHDYGGPAVILDAGTAIKADFVTKGGVHLGGYIVPGLDMMKKSLLANTAKIRFEHDEISQRSEIPHSTADAVASGCMEMALGFIQRLYKQHAQALWIVTGGSGKYLMEALELPFVLDEHLVAKGAKHVLDTRLKGTC